MFAVSPDALELLEYTPPAPTDQEVRGLLQSREQEFQQQVDIMIQLSACLSCCYGP